MTFSAFKLSILNTVSGMCTWHWFLLIAFKYEWQSELILKPHWVENAVEAAQYLYIPLLLGYLSVGILLVRVIAYKLQVFA